MTESTVLPRDGRKYFYWTVLSDDVDLGPVQVQVGGAGTWLDTVATDPDTDGHPRYRMLIAGPDAALGDAALQIGQIGTVWFRARIVDNPEIEISTSSITIE